MAGLDPKRTAENWAYVRRRLRLFRTLGLLALSALLWLSAYALGYFGGVQWGRANPAPSDQTKESNDVTN